MIALQYELSAQDAYHNEKHFNSSSSAIHAFIEEVEELQTRRPKKKRKTDLDQSNVIDSPQLSDEVCVAHFCFSMVSPQSWRKSSLRRCPCRLNVN